MEGAICGNTLGVDHVLVFGLSLSNLDRMVDGDLLCRTDDLLDGDSLRFTDGLELDKKMS